MVIVEICLLPFAAGFEPVMATIAAMSVIDAIGVIGTVFSIGKSIFDEIRLAQDGGPTDYTNQLKSISSKVN
jgi:hypothetical protein